jgi:hypothetical protein
MDRILACGHKAVGRHCGRSDCTNWVGLCPFHSGTDKRATCNLAKK